MSIYCEYCGAPGGIQHQQCKARDNPQGYIVELKNENESFRSQLAEKEANNAILIHELKEARCKIYRREDTLDACMRDENRRVNTLGDLQINILNLKSQLTSNQEEYFRKGFVVGRSKMSCEKGLIINGIVSKDQKEAK